MWPTVTDVARLSVCLSVSRNRESKAAEPIEASFRIETRVVARTPLLGGALGSGSSTRKDSLGECDISTSTNDLE